MLIKKNRPIGKKSEQLFLEDIDKEVYFPNNIVQSKQENLSLKKEKKDVEALRVKSASDKTKNINLDNSFEYSQHLGTKLDLDDIEKIFYEAKCYPNIRSFLQASPDQKDTLREAEFENTADAKAWRDRLYKCFLRQNYSKVTGNDVLEVLRPYVEDTNNG